MTWVHDQIFAAGGKHIPSTWASFADQTGVSAVLHFNPDAPEKFAGYLPLQFLWMNVADESQVGHNERTLVVGFLTSCISAGLRVLLHSNLGFHRTRWAYVAYSIGAGRSVKTVLRMAAEPPWLAPYDTDREAWDEFAAICRGKSTTR